jgi:hypothetical protein
MSRRRTLQKDGAILKSARGAGAPLKPELPVVERGQRFRLLVDVLLLPYPRKEFPTATYLVVKLSFNVVQSENKSRQVEVAELADVPS